MFVIIGFPSHSALHIASRYGHVSVVTELLQHEADIDLLDNHGFSALHYAAVNGAHILFLNFS